MAVQSSSRDLTPARCRFTRKQQHPRTLPMPRLLGVPQLDKCVGLSRALPNQPLEKVDGPPLETVDGTFVVTVLSRGGRLDAGVRVALLSPG